MSIERWRQCDLLVEGDGDGGCNGGYCCGGEGDWRKRGNKLEFLLEIWLASGRRYVSGLKLG